MTGVVGAWLEGREGVFLGNENIVVMGTDITPMYTFIKAFQIAYVKFTEIKKERPQYVSISGHLFILVFLNIYEYIIYQTALKWSYPKITSLKKHALFSNLCQVNVVLVLIFLNQTKTLFYICIAFHNLYKTCMDMNICKIWSSQLQWGKKGQGHPPHSKMRKGCLETVTFSKSQGHQVGGQSGLLSPDPALRFLHYAASTY